MHVIPYSDDKDYNFSIDRNHRIISSCLVAKISKNESGKKYKIFIEKISRSKTIQSIINNIDILQINKELETKIINTLNNININEIDSDKLYYSFINLSSKINEFQSINCEINFSLNKKTNLLQVDMTRLTSSDFLVNLSLQFSDTGNVDFFVMDNDENNISHIEGTVTRYGKYLSSYRFISIVNLIYSGE